MSGDLTIMQQYDRINQSIFNSSFLSDFDSGVSPQTKRYILRAKAPMLAE